MRRDRVGEPQVGAFIVLGDADSADVERHAEPTGPTDAKDIPRPGERPPQPRQMWEDTGAGFPFASGGLLRAGASERTITTTHWADRIEDIPSLQRHDLGAAPVQCLALGG